MGRGTRLELVDYCWCPGNVGITHSPVPLDVE